MKWTKWTLHPFLLMQMLLENLFIIFISYLQTRPSSYCGPLGKSRSRWGRRGTAPSSSLCKLQGNTPHQNTVLGLDLLPQSLNAYYRSDPLAPRKINIQQIDMKNSIKAGFSEGWINRGIVYILVRCFWSLRGERGGSHVLKCSCFPNNHIPHRIPPAASKMSSIIY